MSKQGTGHRGHAADDRLEHVGGAVAAEVKTSTLDRGLAAFLEPSSRCHGETRLAARAEARRRRAKVAHRGPRARRGAKARARGGRPSKGRRKARRR